MYSLRPVVQAVCPKNYLEYGSHRNVAAIPICCHLMATQRLQGIPSLSRLDRPRGGPPASQRLLKDVHAELYTSTAVLQMCCIGSLMFWTCVENNHKSHHIRVHVQVIVLHDG